MLIYFSDVQDAAEEDWDTYGDGFQVTEPLRGSILVGIVNSAKSLILISILAGFAKLFLLL